MKQTEKTILRITQGRQKSQNDFLRYQKVINDENIIAFRVVGSPYDGKFAKPARISLLKMGKGKGTLVKVGSIYCGYKSTFYIAYKVEMVTLLETIIKRV